MRVMFAGGALLGMAALAQPAFAQEQKPEQKVEAVYVTGTRITTPGTSSNNPITSISAEEIKSGQPMAVEEFFKNLPAAVPAIGPGVNNGTGGGATIDLRGLGPNRTLVLINGRRLVPFDLNGRVDTNAIPIALLSRVDLVTGGASVVYGADAVSGVVNFNLKRNFTGIDLSAEQGISGEHDAKRRRMDLTMGATLDGGKGNVSMSVGKTNVDPLMAGDRPIGKTTTNSVNGLFAGSSTTVPGVVSIAKGATGTGSLAGNQQINPATGLLAPLQDAGTFNTNPLNYFVTGMDRTQATTLANYKINDFAEVYSEIFYTTTFVAAQLAESGTFGNTYNVPIGNPFIPQAARQQICDWRGIPAASCVVGNTTLVPMVSSRRFTELGPRYQTFDNKSMQYTIGLKGNLPFGDWNYDTYWQRGTSDQIQSRKNWGSLSKAKQALNAVSTTACVDPSNGCVPLNIWGAAGSITPAMLNFINLSTLLSAKVQQDVGIATISGDLGEKLVSPWAGAPIGMSFSLEQRRVKAGTLSDQPSQIQSEVLGTGAPTPDRSGEFRLREEAVEIAAPLIKDKFLAKALNLELGYRQSEFTNSGASKTYGSWKYGGEWAVVDAWRFRSMVQKATRAPNVNELFAPQVTGLSNLATDPCQLDLIKSSEANTAGTLSNLCRLTGVPTSVIGSLAKPSSGQINQLSGGNPNLGPEVAKTKTFGFVWEPMPKMAITLDYYEISIHDAISNPSTQDVLDGCYNAAKNPTYAFNSACAIVFRNTGNGTLNGAESKGVFTASSNLGKVKTAGYDFGFNYRITAKQMNMDPKLGQFDINFLYNQVKTNTFQANPASDNRNCLGYYSVACGSPNYKSKWTQRTTWTLADFTVGYNWRHVSGMIEEPGGTVYLPAFSKIDAYNYVDLSANWNINKNWRLNLSINNAFDKQPPLVGNNIATTSTNGGNTMPQAYDTVGRYFTFGATMKF